MKLPHQVCSLSLSLMIYMFTLIRTGKDRKDWILCNVYKVNTILGNRTENGSIFSLQFLMFSTTLNFIMKSCISSLIKYITVPFCQYCFSWCSILLSVNNVHHIVIFKFHHVATHILVMAPNL